ncbi:MAG: hybrid sensor histidine kinase/response regulator, partial [Vicinamibacterales bacterium]
MSSAQKDRRLLIMAPTVRDSQITAELLNGAGIETEQCRSLTQLVASLNYGGAAALIAEEHLTNSAKEPLAAWL